MVKRIFKKILKKIVKIFVDVMDDIFLIIGISLLSIGVFKIYIPAGYIVLGICFIIFAYLFAKRR